MKLSTIALGLTLGGSVLLFAGCAKEKACCGTCGTSEKGARSASVATINTMCPIGGDEFDNKAHSAALTRTYKGQKIGFCCEGCVKKFDGKSDADKDAVLTAAKANKTL
ncbi:MAG: hypothetical protein JNM80_13240 [Phycisphaerae bacterium]|nr:hypothetical protein [Phycisphaerae bacterium]